MLGSTNKAREQIVFRTGSAAGTVQYTVPKSKTAHLTAIQGGTSYYCRINGVDIYLPANSTTEFTLVGGTTIADGNNYIYFVGYLE